MLYKSHYLTSHSAKLVRHEFMSGSSAIHYLNEPSENISATHIMIMIFNVIYRVFSLTECHECLTPFFMQPGFVVAACRAGNLSQALIRQHRLSANQC